MNQLDSWTFVRPVFIRSSFFCLEVGYGSSRCSMSHSLSMSRTSLGRVDLVFLLLSNLATELLLSVASSSISFCDDGDDGDEDDDSEYTEERDDALDENLDGGEDDKYSVSSSAGFNSIPIGSALYFVVEIGSIIFSLYWILKLETVRG